MMFIYFCYVLEFHKDDVWKNQLELSSKDERPTGGNVVPAFYKSSGISKKNKEFVVDSKDQQVLFFFGINMVDKICSCICLKI